MIFIKKKFLLGILFIFGLGILLHFTYDWSNNNLFVGLFSAQNESVFEHTKLLILPTVLWYILSYKYRKFDINTEKYFTSMLISLGTSIISIPLLYYFVSEGLSIDSFILNILIFFISAGVGQILACHYYKYVSSSIPKILIILLSLFLVGIYIYFSINPLNLPIFITP